MLQRSTDQEVTTLISKSIPPGSKLPDPIRVTRGDTYACSTRSTQGARALVARAETEVIIVFDYMQIDHTSDTKETLFTEVSNHDSSTPSSR